MVYVRAAKSDNSCRLRLSDACLAITWRFYVAGILIGGRTQETDLVTSIRAIAHLLLAQSQLCSCTRSRFWRQAFQRDETATTEAVPGVKSVFKPTPLYDHVPRENSVIELLIRQDSSAGLPKQPLKRGVRVMKLVLD